VKYLFSHVAILYRTRFLTLFISPRLNVGKEKAKGKRQKYKVVKRRRGEPYTPYTFIPYTYTPLHLPSHFTIK